jgi:hypothetical protein
MLEQNIKDFNAFGKTARTIFRGDFDAATVRENVSQVPKRKALQTASADQPSEIGWTFEATAGRYAIFVRYASKDERPCELLVNGQPVQLHALFESTESFDLIDCRYQCHAKFMDGENTIAVRSGAAMPHIEEVAVVDLDAGEMLSVDSYWEQRSTRRADRELKRPLVIVPSSFRGAVGVVREVAHDDAAIRRLVSVFGELAKAGQMTAVNGQSAIPWGGPLNGQRFRQQIFAALMRVRPDAIVETGTYVGASSAHFARQGLPVYTCESQDHFYARAIANLSEFSNVNMYLQDSRAFLRGLADDPSLNFECPLFYLDAHWYADLPLAEEIAIIRERWTRFMVMVDDFKVPGARYGFDRYGNGLELTLEYLRDKEIELESMAVMFPTASETAETSVRRGTLILSSPDIFDEHLKYERTMYRYETSDADQRD